MTPKRTRLLDPNFPKREDAVGVPRMKPNIKMQEKIPAAVVERAIVVGAAVVELLLLLLSLNKEMKEGDSVVVEV